MSASIQVEIDDSILDLVRCKARKLVGLARITKSDVLDIQQDLLVDIVKHLPRFNGKKAKRITFVARIANNRISKILRQRLTEMRDVYIESCSLDDVLTIFGDDSPVYRHETLAVDERRIMQGAARDSERLAHLRLDLAAVRAGLPERLQKVCDHLLTLTSTETAKRMGVHRSTLYAWIQKLQDAFRAADLDAYL